MSGARTITLLMVPEPGHFLPTLPIATALRDRGYTVRYVSLLRYRRFFMDHGFDFQPVLSDIFPDESSSDVFDVRSSLVSLRHEATVGNTPGPPLDVPALILPELRQRPSDLLLCDSLLNAARCEALAAELSTPAMLLATQLGRGTADSNLPELVLCPREFETPNEGPVPDGRYYTEPAVHRGRPSETFPWRHLDPQRSLVVCCLGTQCADYARARPVMAAVLDGFRELPPYQLVLATGGLDVPAVAARSDTVIERTIPQFALLGRAKMLITHGGLGSIKEAILCRVPMLVVPFTYDQPANAARVMHHRLGKWLSPENCSPRAVRSLVHALAEDAAVDYRLSAMSAVFHDYESHPRAARLIEEYLTQGTIASDQSNLSFNRADAGRGPVSVLADQPTPEAGGRCAKSQPVCDRS